MFQVLHIKYAHNQDLTLDLAIYKIYFCRCFIIKTGKMTVHTLIGEQEVLIQVYSFTWWKTKFNSILM